jgi:hypothetical protein
MRCGGNTAIICITIHNRLHARSLLFGIQRHTPIMTLYTDGNIIIPLKKAREHNSRIQAPLKEKVARSFFPYTLSMQTTQSERIAKHTTTKIAPSTSLMDFL